MITPALQRLHALWWQPGTVMHKGWWAHLDLASWRTPYLNQPAIAPSLNRLIALRLGCQKHDPIPALSPTAQTLLEDTTRLDTLGMAIGLWALQCPEYLFLRTYRQPLAAALGDVALEQLQTLFPVDACMAPTLTPTDLLATATTLGTAWIAQADDPVIAATSLLLPPPDKQRPPAEPVMPVLCKLLRWL
ncbi:type III secretion system domain-containing protein [Chitinimonas sp. BJB300]|uniref:type III secretion system domain-containing protein n=1 Tax=Chitinimonas sp. BJB300 TaxID=1559339 RepID=UPI000C11D32A|nr:type III secretion system domain-containing protein [Chitinimonas sp. BJB300]PHV11499.1 hypothetical protein CSQ89_10735 [Chitinimonas sp. BJB300]TSJ88506.1 hypothetical protein FG002_010050 [Chitinimonas sp. BJB300]